MDWLSMDLLFVGTFFVFVFVGLRALLREAEPDAAAATIVAEAKDRARAAVGGTFSGAGAAGGAAYSLGSDTSSPEGACDNGDDNGDATVADALFGYLSERCHALPVKADDVEFLAGPPMFFERLKAMVGQASHRIVVSALYIGSGPRCADFVATLVSRLEAVPTLRATFLLDYYRMQDGSNLRMVAALLAPRFSHRVDIWLFQTPSSLTRLVPHTRACEVLGVQHAKFFLFDGAHTILSGANLSDDYFSNRMDRYAVLRDNTVVCGWFEALAHTLCGLSHPLVRDASPDATASDSGGDAPALLVRHRSSGLSIHPNASGLDPSAASGAFRVHARKAFDAFIASESRKEAARLADAAAGVSSSSRTNDTYVFPTLQFARIGIFHDSLTTAGLLSTRAGRVIVTSPYMNLHPSFVDIVLDAAAAGRTSFHFITSSTATNGWKGQGGFAGYIPYFYLQLERAFFYLMRTYGAGSHVFLHEYTQPGTTYHAKGIWVSGKEPPTDQGSGAVLSPVRGGPGAGCPPNLRAPFATAVGSSNYGCRSVSKDVEAQVVLLTRNDALRHRMREEVSHLLARSTVITEERFTAGADGRFQPVVSLIAQLGQGYL